LNGTDFYRWIQTFKPTSGKVKFREQAISTLGAFLGLLLASSISHIALGEINPWFIAPMGASAVLLFAVPASPLAQPWSILGGNLIAGIVGVTAAHLFSNVSMAFSIAVAVSIMLMLACRCLHPPSGAVAMTAILGGSAVTKLGYQFVIWPVMINSLLMLILALVFNNLMGRRYPHHNITTDNKNNISNPLPSNRLGVTSQDAKEAIEAHSNILDISAGDLKDLMLEAQQHAFQRLSGNIRCADIMSKNILALSPYDSLTKALHLFENNNLMSLPVMNEKQRLIGSVSVYHLLQSHDGYVGLRNHMDGPADQVHQVMERKVFAVRLDQQIADLIPFFTDKGFHYLPVINAEQQLLGIIGRADMIAALFEIRLSQQHA
jgi:CBS domain-containing membrane protein